MDISGRIQKTALIAVTAACLGWLLPRATALAQGQPRPRGPEVLTRGPVHEAFAEPYNQDPLSGIIVPKEPPEPVNELPPETRPQGGNVLWIPGYWAWDDQREDFLWVSGAWRKGPPGQRWIPGHWTRVDGGFQWTAGFWVDAGRRDLEYLPEPPESRATGPVGQPPGEDFFWVPGRWDYVDAAADYQWRNGYWSPGHDGWVWIPARYVWTPWGCIYVNGYWDYVLADRGVLFCPVYFPGGYYQTYTPVHVVDVSVLIIHLFVRPAYYHYYFGDYYPAHFADRYHILPWFRFAAGPRYYDPLWRYYHWENRRRGVDFGARIAGWHRYYERHQERRPPHTFTAQQRFRARGEADATVRLAQPGRSLEEFVSARGREFTRLSGPERSRWARTAGIFRETVDARSRVRDQLPPARRGDRTAQRPRIRLPEAPEFLSPGRGRDSETGRRGFRPDESFTRPGQGRPESLRPESRPERRRPETLPPGIQRPQRPPQGLQPGRRPDIRGGERRPESRRGEGRPDIRPGERRPDIRPGQQRPDIRRGEGRPEIGPGQRRPEQIRPEVPRGGRIEQPLPRGGRPDLKQPPGRSGGPRGESRLEGRSRRPSAGKAREPARKDAESRPQQQPRGKGGKAEGGKNRSEKDEDEKSKGEKDD